MGAWMKDHLRNPVETAINRKLNITRARTQMPRLHDRVRSSAFRR